MSRTDGPGKSQLTKPLAWDFHEVLKTQAVKNKVTLLLWVPGHIGIRGKLITVPGKELRKRSWNQNILVVLHTVWHKRLSLVGF